MTFANPIWLVAGVAACIALIALIRWAATKRSDALRRFAAGHLLTKLTASVSPGRRRTKAVLLVAATACLFTALARPQWGTHWEEVSRRGIDILLAVDTSKSMLAPDLAPDRLSRAKFGIHDFVEKLEGDRVGLLPFAGASFLLCPLTLDYGAFLESLEAVDTGIIPEGGTDIAAALRAAEKAFERGANHKILVLMSDGEDLEGEALEAAKAAAEKGITIHTVGVGTPNGELIPLGGSTFVKDGNGEVVKSRLDEAMLRSIAEATGGVYAPLGTRAEGLETIYREKLALVPKEKLSQKMKEVKIDRFEWPLALGILLVVLEFSLGTARREKGTRRMWRPGVSNARPATVASVLMLAFALIAGTAGAEEAETIGDPRIRYNSGTELYGSGAWDEAEQAFQNALDSGDVKLQNDAYYNLGNTYFRQGEAQFDSGETEAVMERWEQAIKTYENALALNPEDEDATFNKELVEKKLEDLKQEQEQDASDQESGEEENESEESESESDSGEGENQEGQESSDQESSEDESEGGEGSEPEQESGEGQGGQGEQEQDEEEEASDDPSSDQNEGEASEPEKEDKPGQPGEEEASEETNPDGETSSSEQPEPASPGEEDQASAPQEGSEGTGPADQVAAPNATPRTPGEMSEEEAMQLLDSLTSEEGKFQAPSQLRGRGLPGSLQPKRDW